MRRTSPTSALAFMRGRSLRGPAAVHRPRNAAHLVGRWRAEEDHQLAQLSSDWLTEPSHYAIPQYVADCVTLIARLDVPTMARVRHLDGRPHRHGARGLREDAHTPIARLVMNDIGPELGLAGVSRIGTHVGTDPHLPHDGAAR